MERFPQLRMVRTPDLPADDEGARETLRRCLDRGLAVSIYTHELFATGNDVANRAAVAAVATDRLDLVGLAVHAERKDVDKVTKGLTLHP